MNKNDFNVSQIIKIELDIVKSSMLNQKDSKNINKDFVLFFEQILDIESKINNTDDYYFIKELLENILNLWILL